MESEVAVGVKFTAEDVMGLCSWSCRNDSFPRTFFAQHVIFPVLPVELSDQALDHKGALEAAYKNEKALKKTNGPLLSL